MVLCFLILINFWNRILQKKKVMVINVKIMKIIIKLMNSSIKKKIDKTQKMKKKLIQKMPRKSTSNYK